jgi:NAD(P)-dependent dehydrogenase (short-subunit alcohol dehydrogenase family)
LLTFLAASGIGRATSLAFAKDGAVGLVIADVNLEGAQETAAQAKAVAVHPDFRVDAVHVDVANEDSVKASIAHASKFLGRIDYAVHSAGVSLALDNLVSDTEFCPDSWWDI